MSDVVETPPGLQWLRRTALRGALGLVTLLGAAAVSGGELALDLRAGGHYTSNLNNGESARIRP